MSPPYLDSSDVMFWTARNWPGGRAPCKWDIETREDGYGEFNPAPWKLSAYWVHVTLWVPFGGGSAGDDEDLWSMSAGADTLAEAFRVALSFDRQLRTERDEHLDAQETLNRQWREEHMSVA